ncbi:MAG: DUF2723 domain-containing protein [candidate division Zixibacteria bacterium]|nr:DUF2723 domain-containing protein [candidate division Zixibacteria bacterium]MBU1470570.1 DUF2723 domain-containing protein [candidate division Zixibacteria bacterium]MBU2624456.1 DUF2723 domain-containing protein [candidate division Zixibacteria bacterium]
MEDLKKSFTDGRRDPWNLIFGIFVLLVSLIVYLMTVQRTLSFWDCGEFITCAHILGIPHPPGTPLFVLIGRVFALFPIGDDPSFRINIISCINSAFAAMYGYFVAAWLIKKWFASPNLSGWSRVTVYLGGVIGGLLFAFGRTNWGNSVEAEVYGTSMLFMMLTIYLLLLWVDHREETHGETYLVLMAYLSTLALGVHMTSYIVVPFAFLLVIAVDGKYRRSWQIWVTFLILLLVIHQVQPFIVASAAWAAIACAAHCWKRISQGWIFSLALPVLALVLFVSQGAPFVPVFVLSFWGWSLLTLLFFRIDASKQFWRISFLVITAALLGYSVQIFIPIRAAQKPIMNMNNPDNWESFKGFLERSQYGTESMITRALHRRGEWINQFGNHPRMGFWGFFKEQYGLVGKRFLILFFLGLYGMYYTTRKHWKSGIFVFLITLAGTVGLVIYMNFADGTQENTLIGEGHLEVRDRDYFWTPGFVMFGLMIGLGVAAFFDMIRNILIIEKASPRIRDTILAVLCLSFLLPAFALANNYFINDRSRNFIPYDYAWNILDSARPNAVLFTNGDNDTFPVWCLQYVYGIRPDVKIANLSLINTNWYIKQLKNELGVPIRLTDSQIDGLMHRRTQDGGLYRVQDQMIAEIIDDNQRGHEQTPVQFAVTVSTRNKNYKLQSLDPYMQMEGMALTVYYPNRQPDAIALEKTHDMYWNQFKFRGVTDTTLYKDENADRLVNNYISGFLFMADTLQRAGRIDEAASEIRKGIGLVGGGLEPWAYLCRMYTMNGRLDDAIKVLDEAPDDLPKRTLKQFIAAGLSDAGRKAEARAYFEDIYRSNPGWRDGFNELFRFYFDQQMQAELARLLYDYTNANPGDAQIAAAYQQLKQEVPELFVPESLAIGIGQTAVAVDDTGRRLRILQLDSAAAIENLPDTGDGK